jgi:tetratricopeptide (TPR) repeat protein/transcriptional regulator with XRE-family HTH domain
MSSVRPWSGDRTGAGPYETERVGVGTARMEEIDPDVIRTGVELTDALGELFRRGGWSHHRLAEAAGLSAATVQAIVNGRTGIPRTRTLKAFVQACGQEADRWVAARGRAVRTGAAKVSRVFVPWRTEMFVGRAEDLTRLDRALADPGGTRVSAVHGLGGIGKSTLAAQYAGTRADRYDLVWWITADSPTAIEAGLAALGAELSPDNAQGLLEELAERAVRWLAAHDRWLLVLDNVSSPGEVERLLARAPAGRFLITSRLGTGWHRVTGSLIRLDVLSDEQANDLLTRITTLDRPGASLDGAAELCAWLGGLPLAIEQAAAYLHQNQLTPRAYLDLLIGHPGPMYDQPPQGLDPERTIARIWRVTLDRLSGIPLTGDLLRILAWWESQDIPRALLDAAADAPDLQQALGALAAYNMINLGPATIAVHRLVQAVTRAPDPHDPHRRPTDIDHARDRATALLVLHLPAPQDPDGWPEWRALLPHIDGLLDHASSDTDTQGTYRLLGKAMEFLRGQGAVGRATAHSERALAAARRLWGEDHLLTLVAVNNLALCHKEAGDLGRAIPLYEQSLADLRRIFGTTDPETLTCGNNLASAYKAAYGLGRAIPLYEQTLTDSTRILGQDHPFTLMVGNNLADAYDESDDPERAAALYERVLAARVSTLGDHHPDTLTSRNGLANAYESAGDLQRAIPLYEQTLTDSTRTLGEDHPKTLSARNNLAYAHRTAGDLDQALRLFERTLTDCEQTLGAEHPLTLTVGLNLARSYESAGDPQHAIPLYEQTLTDSTRILGQDHPDTLATRVGLANAYESAGDLQRAIPLHSQNVDDCVRVLGPDHPRTLEARHNLGYAHQSAGDLTRAIPVLERNYADSVRVLGDDNANTLRSGNTLAYAYQCAGDPLRSIPLLRKVLADQERTLGTDHPDTLTSRNNLAGGYRMSGSLKRATALFERTLTDCERALGPLHPQSFQIRYNLASAYATAGNLERAIPLYQQIHAEGEHVLGNTHTLIKAARMFLQTR